MINRRVGGCAPSVVSGGRLLHRTKSRVPPSPWNENEATGAGGRRKSHLNSKSISQPLPHDVVAARRGYRSSVAYRSKAVRWPVRPPWPHRSPFPSRRRLTRSIRSTRHTAAGVWRLRPGAIAATTAAATASNIKYDICTARNRRSHRLQQLLRAFTRCNRMNVAVLSTVQRDSKEVDDRLC